MDRPVFSVPREGYAPQRYDDVVSYGSAPRLAPRSKPRVGSARTRRGSGKKGGRVRIAHDTQNAISKLSDVDTAQVGVEALDKIAKNISVQDLPVMLSCLYEIHDGERCSTKKEIALFFGRLAVLFQGGMLPYVIRCSSNMIRRLEENDSQTREAIAKSMGEIVRYVIETALAEADPENSPQPHAVYDELLAKLFKAMSSGIRNKQIGASLCLSKVIYNSSFNLLRPFTSAIIHKCNSFQRKSGFEGHVHIVTALSNLIFNAGDHVADSLRLVVEMFRRTLGHTNYKARLASADALQTCAARLSECDDGTYTVFFFVYCIF